MVTCRRFEGPLIRTFLEEHALVYGKLGNSLPDLGLLFNCG